MIATDVSKIHPVKGLARIIKPIVTESHYTALDGTLIDATLPKALEILAERNKAFRMLHYSPSDLYRR